MYWPNTIGTGFYEMVTMILKNFSAKAMGTFEQV